MEDGLGEGRRNIGRDRGLENEFKVIREKGTGAERDREGARQSEECGSGDEILGGERNDGTV